ncbi:hypothetical protein L6164_020320 [Bauhinia variegata]|uniref:Uncharacterized protein n=1 Tax=Bauhinia variegata TaxID=167791 RepID=A0ACB9MW17_BAUVA|nr:hypothetical protein L6164_020320 [Bauhinia variegata]
MALIPELLANIILLVTRPFSILKLACLFGVRTIFTIIHAWIELVRATISFHVNIIWGIITWTIGLISLPVRVAHAMQRERQLEQLLGEMQNELEILVWEQKELQEHFQMAVKERKMMELVLAELEEEHDMAITKIEKLECKLRDITNENLRLKEIRGKEYWNTKGQDDTNKGQKIGEGNYGISHADLSLKSSYTESGIGFQDLVVHKNSWEDENKNRAELLKLVKTVSKSGTILTVRPEMILEDEEMSEVLDHRRDVALSQSLFSVVLSLVVGVIVWKAEDPCMPLVVALFIVVGMSLKSVVQFFSTIKNKPASDAVSLLSLNWFLLGTLTYPTLPRVARMMAPLLLGVTDQTMHRLGLSFS